ncbi:signal peptidase I [Candidatus Roizmanbacteria bacterium CG_4_9_14_0_2_um_filter_39_13]|uniref:Signal peptidase I n=2 Tax=Candidatus Roizmaniibacteriota TaxID=1752723 RepID=A0A2M8EWS1_9BACT|nr:MAG: signal peptidase I [Candidatus Roizmanbacteria bacterium CG_4_10_14_0_2_um_filter_39_12]PJC30311.1 MAG: signal peptidase I [Candidatus Roizmanbacteria bacterium CG_4_9_14_0_2_um_filter_39_13]PJE61739.1 MAG: signal peptidase I [Candidatus Roizmanbacteria bacterium CG10_big_fil_rev_8_21_14_0_10_39_12]
MHVLINFFIFSKFKTLPCLPYFFSLNVFISLFISNGLLGKFFIFINISNSMSPSISRNDLVIVQKMDLSQYSVGDIISFTSNRFEQNGVITHRIDSIENGQFITKGDNNELPDSKHIIPIQIKGSVNAIIPYLGFLTNSVNSMIGKVLFLIIPMVIIIITELKNIQNYGTG